ncbi:Retrovirus-related Pol polyprotein from transposon 297 [Vitis vinifera]|uniref:Retrovirus-related Pol polyprotein from transposon 297 n=2 Tax=Vitis vinifera TaxID=29760 RepID=A0A438G809_VITVI|nr:Retrovirus-related Pol polyprotein from transposon 297 [Vitis vinifera]
MVVSNGERLSSPRRCNEWLGILHPILWDFGRMQMQFTIARRKVLLQGSTSSELRALESNTISRTLRQNDGRGIILQLCAIQHGHTNHEELLSDAMAPLLIEFSELFEAPTRLPPPHSHDHRIPLQPGAGPICVCPYRSPHFHKQEIECLVKEMLSQAEEAFELLKQTMMQALVLALPNFQLFFVVECDASGNGLGVVLMQEQIPIAYFSTALNGKRLLLSTYEKELMALVLTVKKWRPYLLGHHFVVQTNQRNLKFLWEQQIMTEPQQKWLLKLMGYDFSIEFKRGKNNMAANALSRNDTRGEFNAVSSPLPQWLESIKVENQSHPELQRIHHLHEQGEAIGP